MWICNAPAFGITFVSPVDASDPIAGVDCELVTVPIDAPSTTKWNAGVRLLRFLLEL